MMRCSLFVSLLLSSGASKIHDFVQQDRVEELKTAPEQDLNEIGPGGQSPLMLAVLSGKEEAVRVLLDRGADTSIAEKDGYTPCHGAGFQGRAHIMKMLLDHGLPCTTDRHKDGYTPLHRACWGGEPRHTETVRTLLRAGAPPDQAGDDGRSPLAMTQNYNTKKLLKHRLQKRAEVKDEM